MTGKPKSPGSRSYTAHILVGSTCLSAVVLAYSLGFMRSDLPIDLNTVQVAIEDGVTRSLKIQYTKDTGPESCDSSIYVEAHDGVENRLVASYPLFLLTKYDGNNATETFLLPDNLPAGKIKLQVSAEFRCGYFHEEKVVLAEPIVHVALPQTEVQAQVNEGAKQEVKALVERIDALTIYTGQLQERIYVLETNVPPTPLPKKVGAVKRKSPRTKVVVSTTLDSAPALAPVVPTSSSKDDERLPQLTPKHQSTLDKLIEEATKKDLVE